MTDAQRLALAIERAMERARGFLDESDILRAEETPDGLVVTMRGQAQTITCTVGFTQPAAARRRPGG